jgi:hypothetical protein
MAGKRHDPAHGTISTGLILPDRMMEPIDYQKTLQKIRANPVIPYIPVLMYPGEKITPGEERSTA